MHDRAPHKVLLLTEAHACMRRRTFILCATRSSSASTGGGADGGLQAGMLVEYRKDADRHVLVLILEPNGRTNWWGIDQVRSTSWRSSWSPLDLPTGGALIK